MSDTTTERRRFQRIAFDAATELAQASEAGRLRCTMCRSKACWSSAHADWNGDPDQPFTATISLEDSTRLQMEVVLTRTRNELARLRLPGISTCTPSATCAAWSNSTSATKACWSVNSWPPSAKRTTDSRRAPYGALSRSALCPRLVTSARADSSRPDAGAPVPAAHPCWPRALGEIARATRFVVEGFWRRNRRTGT